jgi:hypothetical protein
LSFDALIALAIFLTISWDTVPFEAQYIIIGQIFAITAEDVVINASTIKLGALAWMDGTSVNNTQVCIPSQNSISLGCTLFLIIPRCSFYLGL